MLTIQKQGGTDWEMNVVNKHHYEAFPENDISDAERAHFDEGKELALLYLDPMRTAAESMFGEEYVSLEISHDIPTNAWIYLRPAMKTDRLYEIMDYNIKVQVFFPDIDVINEYGASHNIKDFRIDVHFGSLTQRGARLDGLYGLRYSYSLREAGHRYCHSHLSNVRSYPSPFCLGASELAIRMGRRVSNSQYEYLFGLIYSLAGTESIAGSPYRRLDSVIDVNAALSAFTGGGGRAPVVDPAVTATILKKALRHGVEFPLTIDQTSLLDSEVRLQPDQEEFLGEVVTQYAPDRIKTIRGASSGYDEATIRSNISIYEANMTTRDQLIFNDTLYERLSIEPDEEEKAILSTDSGEPELILPDHSKQWLVNNMKTLINRRLQNESRWDIQTEA
jgi:hypothetical protein